MFRYLVPALYLTLAGGVLAQSSGIPPEEMTNTRRQSGDQINVCFDRTSQGYPFDLAVAESIGDALFLQVNVIDGFGGFPLNGDGFVDELNLAMNNTCDLFMGVTVSTNSPVSEAFSITRPYVTVPFVLAVSNEEWESLADIPKDAHLGTAMASMGEMNYITWAQQQSESDRWGRWPYADPNLMTTRVLDGTIAGMILWQPVLARLQREREDAQALRVIANSPIPEADVHVGALVSSRDAFLRSQVDEAIDALIADGSIDALMTEFGYVGHAGE